MELCAPHVGRGDSSFAREAQLEEDLALALALELSEEPLRKSRCLRVATRSSSFTRKQVQEERDHAEALKLSTDKPVPAAGAASSSLQADGLLQTADSFTADCKHRCKDKRRCKHLCCKGIRPRERKTEQRGGLALLRQRFATKGWRMRDVVGDGACQFRALAQQLWGGEEHHSTVRAEVVNHLRANPPPFLDVSVYYSAQGKRGAWAVFDTAVDSLESYLDLMKENTTWGDQTTLQAQGPSEPCDVMPTSRPTVPKVGPWYQRCCFPPLRRVPTRMAFTSS